MSTDERLAQLEARLAAAEARIAYLEIREVPFGANPYPFVIPRPPWEVTSSVALTGEQHGH